MLKKVYFILQPVPLLLFVQSDLNSIQNHYSDGISYSLMHIPLDSVPGTTFASINELGGG